MGDGELAVVAIDIPIGLPSEGSRQADLLARTVVGARASSVFSTPVRAALAAGTHAEATTISAQLTGRGLSRQAYALATKILDVDRWVRTASEPPIEVHPEVCFATMAGHPLQHPKSTWAGSVERRRLLARAGVMVPDELGLAGEMAGPDDVLDAAAAAWTAQRFLHDQAVSYPATPESFSDGHLAAIWA
jgi:predicted RNase H-like nuclease